MLIQSALDLIKFHEGCTLVAKPDRKGAWEIGYGHDGAYPGQTCTQDWADADVAQGAAEAEANAGLDLGAAWDSLDEVRRAVLTDMSYELGRVGLAGFTTFLGLVRANNWAGAAADLHTTLIYRQVPSREAMNCTMLVSGQWPTV